jgi:hypothetical protein
LHKSSQGNRLHGVWRRPEQNRRLENFNKLIPALFKISKRRNWRDLIPGKARRGEAAPGHGADEVKVARNERGGTIKPRPGPFSQPRRALPYRAMPCLPCSTAQGVSQVPPKPDPKSDHELTTEALRLARALDVVAADRDRRDMTSLHERPLLCRVVKGTPDERA